MTLVRDTPQLILSAGEDGQVKTILVGPVLLGITLNKFISWLWFLGVGCRHQRAEAGQDPAPQERQGQEDPHLQHQCQSQ